MTARTGKLSLGATLAIGLVALGAPPGLVAATAATSPATAAGRVALPDPVPSWIQNATDLGPAGADVNVAIRLYLAGRSPAAETLYATAVSTPGSVGYRRDLSPAQFQDLFGAAPTQVDTVESWARGQGLRVTGTTAHYVAVTGNAPAVSRALATTIDAYVGGETGYAPVQGASLPAAVAKDVVTVVGLDSFATEGGSISFAPTSAAPGCSAWWAQHSGAIPSAYGQTTAPDALCGYTPQQMRSAYGIGPYTGKGSTIAVVLDGHLPTMESDANHFFAAHNVAGFSAGQYQENFGPGFASSCGADQDSPEEPLDVETAHIIAPDATIVYVAANCAGFGSPASEQDFLDAETRVVDQHLGDVETDSASIDESQYTPAMAAAWTQILEQGAVEGIGFNFDSGDNCCNGGPVATFPASDPWATAVGGTTLEIGKSGTVVAELAWGDNVAVENNAHTGYLETPPGVFNEGSIGGRSQLFAQPAYQAAVVPASLSSEGNTVAGREVPDISADASLTTGWLIGYTFDGTFSQTAEAGTSGSSPIVAALEADAEQASGHAVGFANPALYGLRDTAAIRDILAPPSPVIALGTTSDLCVFGSRCLITLGLDNAQPATAAYDDATGLGGATNQFIQMLANA